MVFVLVVGGCFAVVLSVDNEPAGRESVTTSRSRAPVASEPTVGEPAAPTAEAATQPEAEPTQEVPAEDAPADAPAGVGDTITLHGSDSGLEVAATVVQIFDPATPVSDYIRPDSGARWVAVELLLKNTGTAVYDDSPSNGLNLIDTEGQQYSDTFGDVREGVDLSSITVGPGDSRKGVVVFEVPKGVKLAKLQLALNSGFAREKGEWTIS
ncbi:DUF4352 domain-containing protein [Acrocarpospora phusangensis]|uniref:DUF4352 domain-containing protein n=1 Tax=Acrocarpospora phusangensis TaxID=1070424 RepID=UPI0019509A02|nr:DUF4352 domain-containing protein [Acrocarpospora phusangensis]